MQERDILLVLLQSIFEKDGLSFYLPETIDWESLIEEANHQSVSVLASDGLQRLYDEGLYSAHDEKEVRRLKARWFGKTMEYEHRYAGQLAAATKMGKWLASTGIQTVILKGFAVSECYPIPAHRYSADFDCFLVKDGEHLEAYELGNQVMEKHEIAVSRGFYKNSSFKVGGLMVENHKFCVPFRGNEVLRRLEQLLQRMILEGPLTVFGDTGLLEPPPLASALFLTEHAYSHFLHEGLNLRHILDWALFRRRHTADVDWTAFDEYVDAFGFRRFYDAYAHLGEFVLGERETLTPLEQRMMDSVWAGLDLHKSVHGFLGKLRLAGNTLRAGWKYSAVSDLSMPRALWIQAKGVLFERNPKL